MTIDRQANQLEFEFMEKARGPEADPLYTLRTIFEPGYFTRSLIRDQQEFGIDFRRAIVLSILGDIGRVAIGSVMLYGAAHKLYEILEKMF